MDRRIIISREYTTVYKKFAISEKTVLRGGQFSFC